MTDFVVTSPQRPYTFINSFKAVSNGDVYIGLVNKDPETPSNQIQVYVVGEDGSETPVMQPLKTNFGGLLVYNGQPSKFIVKQDYSMKVVHSSGQVFYEPKMSSVDPGSMYQSLIDVIGSGDSQSAGGEIWPSTNKSAAIGDTGLDNVSILKDVDGGANYKLSSLVSGEITALSFQNKTATIGGVDVTMKKASFNATDVGKYSAYIAESLTDMIAGKTSGGEDVELSVGQRWVVGGGTWKVRTVPVVDISNFKRMNTGYVSLLEFAHLATPDDWSDAINAANDYARKNGRKSVEYPSNPDGSGFYQYKKDITFFNNTYYYGSGRTSLELKPADGAKVKLTGDFVTFKGITLSGANDVEFSVVRNINFDDCYVFGGNFTLSDFKYVTFEKTDFGGGAQLLGTHPSINSISEALKLIGCNVLTKAWIDTFQCVDTQLIGCSFLGTATYQFRAKRGYHNQHFYMPVFISNCVFDAAATNGVRLEGMSFKINNTFISGGRDNNGSGFSANDCIESSMSDTQTRFCGKDGMEFFSCSDIEFSNVHSWDNKTGGASVQSSCKDFTFNNSTFGYNPDWFGGSFVQPIGIRDVDSSCQRINLNFCKFKNMAENYYLPNPSCRVGNTGKNGELLRSDLGAISPIQDNADDLGKSDKRYKDAYFVNNPTVGSDARIKKDRGSIPQALCDLAMGTELEQYRLKDGQSGRFHYGIVITEEFLNKLNDIYGTDNCAAFCHSVFTDDQGNPKKISVGDAVIGDMWQVRYAEWQNILLEAMRRKIKAM